MLPDGTCIAIEFPRVPPSFDPHPALVARRGGAVLWRLAEPDLIWSPEFDVAPFVVRDGSGTAYGAYAPETDEGRLVAADAATGGLRARTPGSFTIVGATEDAALALEGSSLVAVGADGVRRWSTAIGRPFIFPQEVIVDRARERAYVGRREANRWRTTAFDTGDGGVIWRSARGPQREAAVARPGRAPLGGVGGRRKAGGPSARARRAAALDVPDGRRGRRRPRARRAGPWSSRRIAETQPGRSGVSTRCGARPPGREGAART